MPRHVVVIGSGAGASAAAAVLADASAEGWKVTILEKGRNFYRDLDSPTGPPIFGGDEIRHRRDMFYDVFANPHTGRSQAQARLGIDHERVGDVNNLPITVGGGTTSWHGKFPRFWRTDFEMLSRYGPMPGADVADWPFGYDDLAPYYDSVEQIMGIAGSLADTPDFVLDEMPRGEYPMPAGPGMYAALRFAEGAAKQGFAVFPLAEAVNSREYDGRAACNNCGLCSQHGCPIHARAGAAVTFLRHALRAGAELVPRACVTRIRTRADGTASGVDYLAGEMREPATIDADHVILAASCIESTRVALMSTSGSHPDGLGNSSGLLGHYLCFHAGTFAFGVVPDRLHAYKGRSGTHAMMEPCVPSTKLGRIFGLPWLRGGIVESSGSPYLVEEAMLYDDFPLARGRNHKDMMRRSILRDRLLAVHMLAEDVPQYSNTVDLDPTVRDIYGLPVARITQSFHKHEEAASLYWGVKLMAACRSAGGSPALFYPVGLEIVENETASQTRHLSGTMRMGTDATESVTDEFGRVHDAPNVVVCDGATFPTSGAFNPTNTIMAVAMRNATALAHGEGQASRGPVDSLTASA